MKIEQIKAAVDAGKAVHWINEGYRVVRDQLGQYLVIYGRNQACWGLTDRSGANLQGLECEFFIKEEGGP